MNYSTFSFSPDYFKSKIIEAGPKWMIRAAVLLSIALLWLFIFSLISPAAGEAWLFNSFVISGVLTAGFVGLVAMLILGISALFASACISYGYKFARNEIAATNGEVRQLSGGGQYYVGPDIVVVQGEYESRNVFNARVTDFIDNQKQGQWIVALPFQEGYIKIKDDTAKGKQVKRGGEATDKDDYDGMLPHYNPMSFANETRSDYNAYINEFLPRFKTYAEWYRAEKLKQPAFNHVGTITTIFLFLLLSLSATAQTNTDKVYQFLGSAATQKPGIDEPVVFQFEKDKVIRYGDDKTEIGRMVAQRVGADGADYGQLKAVYRSGSLIPVSGKQQIAATGTNEKPAELFKTRMETHNESGPGFQVPDSAATALQIKEAEQFLEKNKKDIIRFSLQWWMSEFASWLLTIISCALAISRTFGASAYNESEQRADGSVIYGRFMAICGHYASAVTFVLYWIAAIVLMPVAFYTLYNYGLWALMVSIFSYKTAMIIACFIIAWVFKKGSEKMVPNPIGSTQRPSNNHYNTGQSTLGPGRR